MQEVAKAMADVIRDSAKQGDLRPFNTVIFIGFVAYCTGCAVRIGCEYLKVRR